MACGLPKDLTEHRRVSGVANVYPRMLRRRRFPQSASPISLRRAQVAIVKPSTVSNMDFLFKSRFFLLSYALMSTALISQVLQSNNHKPPKQLAHLLTE